MKVDTYPLSQAVNSAEEHSAEGLPSSFGEPDLISDDDIDYADIARRTQPGQPGGEIVFDSADYATHEEAMAAFEALLLHDLMGDADEATSAAQIHEGRTPRYRALPPIPAAPIARHCFAAIRELMNAVRRVPENPEINPVRKVDPGTGPHLRRCNVAQFVIVYVYFKPSTREPNGVVSVRAVRHASEEDALWAVRQRHPRQAHVSYRNSSVRERADPRTARAALRCRHGVEGERFLPPCETGTFALVRLREP